MSDNCPTSGQITVCRTFNHGPSGCAIPSAARQSRITCPKNRAPGGSGYANDGARPRGDAALGATHFETQRPVARLHRADPRAQGAGIRRRPHPAHTGSPATRRNERVRRCDTVCRHRDGDTKFTERCHRHGHRTLCTIDVDDVAHTRRDGAWRTVWTRRDGLRRCRRRWWRCCDATHADGSLAPYALWAITRNCSRALV